MKLEKPDYSMPAVKLPEPIQRLFDEQQQELSTLRQQNEQLRQNVELLRGVNDEQQG